MSIVAELNPVAIPNKEDNPLKYLNVLCFTGVIDAIDTNGLAGIYCLAGLSN